MLRPHQHFVGNRFILRRLNDTPDALRLDHDGFGDARIAGLAPYLAQHLAAMDDAPLPGIATTCPPGLSITSS